MVRKQPASSVAKRDAKIQQCTEDALQILIDKYGETGATGPDGGAMTTEWAKYRQRQNTWRAERAAWYRDAERGEKIERKNSIARSARANPYHVGVAWDTVLYDELPYEPTPGDFTDVEVAFVVDRHYPGGWFKFLKDA